MPNNMFPLTLSSRRKAGVYAVLLFVVAAGISWGIRAVVLEYPDSRMAAFAAGLVFGFSGFGLAMASTGALSLALLPKRHRLTWAVPLFWFLLMPASSVLSLSVYRPAAYLGTFFLGAAVGGMALLALVIGAVVRWNRSGPGGGGG